MRLSIVSVRDDVLPLPAPTSDDPAATCDVAVIGLGYVGLTLATALAATGTRVLGYDTSARVVEALRDRRTPFHEAGLAEALGALPHDQLVVVDRLPELLPRAVVICVGTPVDPGTGAPDLRDFTACIDAVAPRVREGTVVIVRSTVPVGTTRGIVVPALAEHLRRPLVAMCPERTIQGQALAELRALPQVIGGLDAESTERAAAVLARLSPFQVRVSSLETAELVKLVNNAHTDLIYGFGNEVALMAEALGVDASEVVRAANVGYPRPDLCQPGFVGGACLTKDPYLLLSSLAPRGYRPGLVAAARALNESLPFHVADGVVDALDDAGVDLGDAKVLVCGLAFKGRPPTDDTRGTPAGPVIARLRDRVGRVVAHDHLVSAARAAELGAPLVDLDEGARDADAVLFLIDHPGYASLDIDGLLARMHRPAVVADVWGLFASVLGAGRDGVVYRRLGRG